MNINDTVTVRLTEHGREVMATRYRDCLPSLGEQALTLMPSPNEDGSYTFPLWSLMATFGWAIPLSGASSPYSQIFVNNEITVVSSMPV